LDSTIRAAFVYKEMQNVTFAAYMSTVGIKPPRSIAVQCSAARSNSKGGRHGSIPFMEFFQYDTDSNKICRNETDNRIRRS
jgi:hypothetical protein